VQHLGADVLYLNPICLAYTNHKYDALDYLQVSPEYGTRDDLKALAADVHMPRHEAGARRRVQPHGPQRADLPAGRGRPRQPLPRLVRLRPQYAGGARAWWRAQNLPELNLENPAVREHIYGGPTRWCAATCATAWTAGGWTWPSTSASSSWNS
jgi:cyclomaltodextrinase